MIVNQRFDSNLIIDLIINFMKGNRVLDYNLTSLEADKALCSYVANDYNKLGKIAFGCIRLTEVSMHDQTVEIPNRIVIQEYYNNVFTKHPCLVIKTDKLYSYTRNNVCKVVRGKYAHTHETGSISKNNEKKRKALADFMDEKCSANILFCVMQQWVKTPFLQSVKHSLDSQFFMKEDYTNKSGQKSKLGIIESIIFNIHDELAYILNNGRIGWNAKKAIFPFVDSYEEDFGKELFENIKETIPWLSQMNKEYK